MPQGLYCSKSTHGMLVTRSRHFCFLPRVYHARLETGEQSDWKFLNGTREFSKMPNFPLFGNTEKVVLIFRKSFPEKILFHSIPTRNFRKFRRMESTQCFRNNVFSFAGAFTNETQSLRK